MKYKKNKYLNIILLFIKAHYFSLIVVGILLLVLLNSIGNKSNIETKTVLVSKAKLISGQKIKESDISTINIPKDTDIIGLIPESEKEKIVGSYTSNNINENELFILDHLYNKPSEVISDSLSLENSKLIFLSSKDVAFMPANLNPSDMLSIYTSDTKTGLNKLLIENAKIITVDTTHQSPEYVGLELQESDILLLNQALALKYYIQVVVNP